MIKKSPIAVVGMAGLFPGALDLDTFWHNIISKVDATGDVPEDRWIVEPDLMVHPEPGPDKAISKRACLIRNFTFDPEGIDIDPDLLAVLDPLYHMVLHAGRESFSQIRPNEKTGEIAKERTGVILAAIALPTDGSSYISREILGRSFEEKLFGDSARPPHENNLVPLTRNQSLAGRVTSLPAAVLARSLGLGGGSFTLDAACASSLYAVKLACDQLHFHRADVMLAGGVSRPECLYTQVGFSQLRALSPTGRCAPFDQSADGIVVGEGVGILALKRLDDALRDEDSICGLIRGIGLSNDMRGNLLAPDSEGQLRAMRSAYESADWSPNDVDLIECHGAGTPVGDITELLSLKKLWEDSGGSNGHCAIGSVKSMIGHLLTAAGAAGMIKILLALKHKTLPPSLHFQKAPEKSPLQASPFRVQTVAEKWIRKKADTSLRAAVSAFGFGGINAHMLLEEWDPNADFGFRISDFSASHKTDQLSDTIPHSSIRNPQSAIRNPPVAIVGMEAVFGSLASLRAFQEAVLSGDTTIGERPAGRWKGCENIAARYLENLSLYGGFMDELSLDVGAFHIPPNEIPDILPQHLLMLKVAAGAMKDAGLVLRADHRNMGVVIGMEFDFEATNFHLRWNLNNLIGSREKRLDVDLDGDNRADWIESLKDGSSPPLTPTRTLGALGGIIASRIAREFRFGGPSFVVSCESASGLKALEIGVRSLQQNETEAVLVGAVDLAGDVRSVITSHTIRPFSRKYEIRPFDRSADGPLPGEGAAALILKRLDRALADGHRIYAVIKGIGCASGNGIDVNCPSKETYTLSLERSIQDADISPASIGYIETHGSGAPSEDNVEGDALHDFFGRLPKIDKNGPCAIGSVIPSLGHCGAAAGLAALVKTSLCLYQEIIPPLKNYSRPGNDIWHQGLFHIPGFPQYWLRDRQNGPRRASAAAMTPDGNCVHVILESFPYEGRKLPNRVLSKVEQERKRPLGYKPRGLFAVEGNNKESLIQGLDDLKRYRMQIEPAARTWHLHRGNQPEKKMAVSIAATDHLQLENSIEEAKQAVLSDTPMRGSGPGSIWYSPEPVGGPGEIAFVFPGSGNHYVGMGREIGVQWPEILRNMDAETLQLKTQIIPQCFVPQGVTWEPGWEKKAHETIISDPLHMIFGQVVHGGVIANLLKHFKLTPSAVIGYSLGESAGLFAMGAWPDRGVMLKRMLATNLFHTELAGPCNAARKVWNVPAGEAVNWCAATVNRPAEAVKNALFSSTNLLIVNTPDECVIGGRRPDVEAAINKLGCEAVFLEGVVTVHCEAAVPVKDAYRSLHLFPTQPPEGIRFYSCAFAKAYPLNSESAADSILTQALSGFDFTATIKQAYQDGVRIFVEMGPHSSCTRMIRRILDKKPHLAVSASVRGEDDYVSVLHLFGALIAERVPVDMDSLYGNSSYALKTLEPDADESVKTQILTVGGKTPSPALPVSFESGIEQSTSAPSGTHYTDLIDTMAETIKTTSDAHKAFLEFSDEQTRGFGKTFALQTQLLRHIASDKDLVGKARIDLSITPSITPPITPRSEPDRARKPVFSREQCMEFATGSVANVLGPEFAEIDTYKARVRLPDEPLMLVDRILSIEGKKGSLGPGRVVTEHDVTPGAWYLDGGRAPVCISVEAGQADLFLCAYLGIDHAVKGERTYRLLDATVKFHRDLPLPGDVIRYEIEIERFARQNDTFLFFFHFEGFIGNTHLISMTDGCAGFFTEEEVRSSGGIILTAEDTEPMQGKRPADWTDLVPVSVESYNDHAVEALRKGNLFKCFGDLFEGITLAESLCLPGDRMKLIDRVLLLDPEGGRYGLGLIRAEADIHPDDWFLTCHFVDDMVMPGTLMYECCTHTLKVFVQRMGWVTEKPGVCYEPVVGAESRLKCRGPVTPGTRHVHYEVEIKEIGYTPEPYVIGDAHMYADGHRIVLFRNISMKMTGITREEIESLWEAREKRRFDRSHILAFAVGNPSEAFGKPYRVFDNDRFIARLPGPPYSFIDRITRVEPPPWVLKPDGWIEAEYDVKQDAWYYKANRTSKMPYCVLNEIALQPCGWLAAYIGSALNSEKDLKFRNLGGNATLYTDNFPDSATLITRARMTKVSQAGEMIIEHFDFKVLESDKIVYEGTTNFGFFTRDALSNQVGLSSAEGKAYMPTRGELDRSISHALEDQPPLSPDDPDTTPHQTLALPAKTLRMIDEIKIYVPNGGPAGLGFIQGKKTVDPDEWFFKAHFYQDPVCPGSLGIESFLQLVKFAALDRWRHLADSHRFSMAAKTPHSWIYRGQIIPENIAIEVVAVITRIQETPVPMIMASGLVKVDGLYIYHMENFGLKLIADN